MAIDFQPVQSDQTTSNKIDFQAIQGAAQASQAQPAVQAAQATQGTQDASMQGMSGSTPVDAINSLGSGIGQGIGKAVRATEGFGTDIAQGVGAISPQTKQSMDQKTDQLVSPNQTTQDAAQQFPMLHAAGQGIGVVGSAAMATGAATLAASVSTGVVSVATAGLLANGIIGSISSGDGLLNRSIGAVTGVAIPAAINKAAQGVKALANAGIVQSTIKNTVSYINSKIQGTPLQSIQLGISNLWNTAKATSDQFFSTFRAGAGDFSSEAYKLGGQVVDTLDQFKGRLDNNVQDVFQGTLSDLKQASSIADLHDIRVNLNNAFDIFNPKLVGPNVTKAYHALQDNLDTAMVNAATKAGVLPAFKAADSFYKTQLQPLKQIGADDISKGVKDIQDAITNKQPIPMDAANNVKNVISKFIKPNQPDMAKSFMSVLDTNSQNAVRAHVLNEAVDRAQTASANGIQGPLKLQTELGKLKGTYAEVFNTPESQAMIDGMSRVIQAAAPVLKLAPIGSAKDVVMHLGVLGSVVGAGAVAGGAPLAAAGGAAYFAGKALLNTGAGQAFLRAIGTSSLGTQILHQMIESGGSVGAGAGINSWLHQVRTPPVDPNFQQSNQTGIQQ